MGFNDCYHSSDMAVLKAFWNHAQLKIRAGLSLSDLVDLLVDVSYEDTRAQTGCVFHDEGLRPNLRNTFHRQVYQHLLAAVRRNEAVLSPPCRVKLLSLWSASTATDASSREVTVTADMHAVSRTCKLVAAAPSYASEKIVRARIDCLSMAADSYISTVRMNVKCLGQVDVHMVDHQLCVS